MPLKELCMYGVSALMGIFALRYAYQIRKKTIEPTLATWILFLSGVGLSFVTYILEEEWDFVSGINNTADMVVVLIVIISLLLWGDKRVRFEPWEKYYLGAAGFGVVYAVITGELWNSNIYAQLLIIVGSLATINTMIAKGRNTESFTGWGIVWLAHLVGLVPALVGGNVLSATYVIRGLVSVTLTLLVMIYYEIKVRRRAT